MHADTGGAPQAAEELGMWVIGYNNPMDKYAPTRHLVTPIWNWGKYYDYAVKNIEKGTWKSEQIWWSMKDGMVDLSAYGKAVSEDTKKLVAAEKKKILDGKCLPRTDQRPGRQDSCPAGSSPTARCSA